MEKIQELTEKIYREGVEKGQAEADRIIQEAKEQAAQIIAEHTNICSWSYVYNIYRR